MELGEDYRRSATVVPSGLKRRRSTLASSASQAKRAALSNRNSLDPIKATPAQKRRCTVQAIGGKNTPSLNGLFTRVVDARPDGTAWMYIYGGTREISDTESELTNDFFRLDLTSLMWEDLSGTLVEAVDAHDPFSRRLIFQDLPKLEDSTSSLYRSCGRTYMLIFGGTDSLGNSTSELISVNLSRLDGDKSLTWERIQTTVIDDDDTDLKPRSGAASVVVGGMLYIFGGWSKEPNQRKARPMDSFSVLDLKMRHWLVLDRPYPHHVGGLGHRMGVFAPEAYKGCKILLMRGKQDLVEIDFKGDCMFLFNTQTHAFVPQPHGGDTPLPMVWYDLSPHRASERTCVVYGSVNQVKAMGELPSDMWTFDVLSDRWRCENMEKELWSLDMDLQTLEHIPGKGWCLFGYREPTLSPMGKKSNVKAPAEVFDRIWNVCVTLDVENAK